MYNINDINNGKETKMTIYYFKSSGIIREISTGVQDMSTYGEHEQDYAQILDFVVVDLDMYIFDNSMNFIIVDGKPKLKSAPQVDLSKYM
jgi:predicted subunit of tRNA(5-methylaminomethyl-2-thiouridylate) methyltransferase